MPCPTHSSSTLQQRYSYAVLLQQDLDNLHALCTKQKQDLQAARQQLAAVRQQNLDAVADVDQRAAAERHVVIQTGRGLWEEWRGAREQLSGLNDKLQQTNADTDATVLELGETCQAGQQHKVELKTLFANNGVLKEEVWRLELDLEQLKDEFTEAAAALVSGATGMGCRGAPLEQPSTPHLNNQVRHASKSWAAGCGHHHGCSGPAPHSRCLAKHGEDLSWLDPCYFTHTPST
jgi:hypothetical protein